MQKIIRIISIIFLVISIILLPFLGIGILFGLAGSTANYFYLIGISYLTLIISLIISIFRYKFFLIVIISIILMGVGFTLDSNFWEKNNAELCEDLRAEPSCVESVCGFTCESFGEHGFGFTTSGSICKDKDMGLCREKTKKVIQTEKDVQDALTVYSNIVDKIIASPSPENENFENRLVAIYNCLEMKYGPGAKGEGMAIQILVQKNLNQEQLNKYYVYLSSKGRNVNTEKIVAGLPAGDKSLSCKDINN